MKTKFFGEKLECPACGDVAMSAMRKFNLGAGWSVDCNSCGVALTVPWQAMLIVPLVVFPYPMLSSGQPVFVKIALVVFLFAVVWLSQKYVAPLNRARS